MIEKSIVTEVDYEESYHSTRHNNHSNNTYYEARAKIALIKFFNSENLNSRILDYGCGLGQNIYYLKNSVGYEISKYARDFCKKKGIEVTGILNEIEDESFDIVFSSHVLEHHPHPKTMIEEMYQKLKPGKKLILVIPYERHKKAKFTLDLNQHLYNWNFQNINNLLLISGFEILENKYIRGAGYFKLLPLAKLNFRLYWYMTNLVSHIVGIKEIMIVARKL